MHESGPLRRLGAALARAKQQAFARVHRTYAEALFGRYRAQLRAAYPEPTLDAVVSQLATAAQLDSARFRGWCEALHLPLLRHRKWWEFAWIGEALEQHGMLGGDRRGLGFGVGREPLAAHFASRGSHILATDAPIARDKGWAQSNQHAAGLAALNEGGLCPAATFDERVRFRPVDMNRIPKDLTGFDFCWSACAFEHLGSIDAGLVFVERSLECLAPGGFAAHTTEFNLSSDRATIERGDTVVFRRRDLEALARRLRSKGHTIELNLNPGDREIDRYVDLPPYRQDPHVKLLLGRYVSTSVGLLIQKAR